ncbi:AraC-like DNA-binding protein [Scopulibacillus darangshiensis]|uniref:AraC-like DNA-binding protein n=1 Tax=Scopulibacillus darangshiensis TaxID=442528 RepID=A0A4R2P2V2_9BACL|nr:AraC family transcriptional regulator [Scopulibacillus darangshiensis]TCP29063.1 AraC-like DNA-binding protein [Scopulibacillus darangshiensis]
MLSNGNDKPYGYYGFRFYKDAIGEFANIWNVGWEIRTSTDYDWNGRTREESGAYIFQYTLNGEGRIEYGGKAHSLKAGDAFIVKVPGDHRYFFPETSETWEFMFLTLVGEKAEACWDYLIQEIGHIAKIPPDAAMIQLLRKMNHEAAEGLIQDGYVASARAYEFIMESYRYAKNLENRQVLLPEPIVNAQLFMQSYFSEPITLEDISEHVNLSRYYFIQQFRKYTGATPKQHLVKIRMEKAIELLSHTDLSIKDIAKQVGYEHPNYFSKAFRKSVGESAGRFRENIRQVPLNRVVID